MDERQWVIGGAFLLYLLTMFGIGYVAWRRTRSMADFVLGGRRLGSWVTALSASASDMSGWLLLGLPGYAYVSGLESLWLSAGLLLGAWLNWRLVAARLRVASERAGNALTLPEYFSNRFDDQSGLIRLVSALFILLFFTFYTSSGLVAGGKLFESVFGIPYLWAVSTGALTVILYTAIGGFLAVSWTDLVQGLLMAAALAAAALMASGMVGSTEQGILASLPAPLLDPFTDKSGEVLGWVAIISLLAWGLGYFGQPHILARFKAVESVSLIPRSRHIAIGWMVLTLLCASLAGLAGNLHFSTPLADSETVFIQLAELLFHPLVAGICLAAILAAIMSTADSQLLVASSAFSEDFYKGLLRRRAGDRELVAVGRLAVVVIACLAFLLALNPQSKVLDLVAYAWAGFGAAFGPAVILSLYWPKMTRQGALAGILVGGMTVVVWKQLEGGLFELYELLPGFLASTGAILFVSKYGPQSPQTNDK
jgi:sodium/proline symporter